MSLYESLLRPAAFLLDPEKAHNLGLWAVRRGLVKVSTPDRALAKTVFGVRFPNPIGLAAGFDKNGVALERWKDLGFGFVEIGTVTRHAQPGNPKPRMFRLPEHQAIINRMGFNNEGLAHLLARVDKRRYRGILGINVGKNKDTPNDQSESDYRKGISAVYSRADYITVNVSSPNTPGLRDLQFGDSLKGLLAAIKDEQLNCQTQFGRYVPIAVKIAPDMDDEGIRFVASALRETGLDGVIATNTTISREAVAGHRHEREAGGLSGAPVREASLRVIRGLYAELGEALPIIGVGGITDGESAAEKIRAGARLVQIYTGFIYRGPVLIRESVEAIRRAQ